MSSSPTYPVLSAYLTANDAAKAIDFYKVAFDAQELFRLMDKKGGRVGHAELTIQGQMFMIADEFPGMNTSPQTLGGVTSQLVLMVPDTDAAYQKALDAGAVSVRPPATQFYGFRMAVVADPGGHRWMLQTEVEKVSPEEMQKRWDAMDSDCTSSSDA